MINIKNAFDCCGCESCVQVCPANCITMISDEEGFSYPKVLQNECVDCKACEKVCPMLGQETIRQVKNAYSAYSKDNKTVRRSTSGGIFQIFATYFISQHGVVFGAKFEKFWQVIMDEASTQKEAEAFNASKYVQASVGSVYRAVKTYLREGRKVLFTGTPCQVAGLNKYLYKEYENLLTVEVACDGVPSPKVWNRYLLEKTNGHINRITDVKFRYKPDGWKGYRLMVEVDGKQLSVPRNEDPYIQGFINGLTTRPSCVDCRFRNGKSHADITLADFWGVERLQPEMDNKYGVSLVIVRTEKGAKFFPNQHVNYKEVSLSQAIQYNDGLREHHHCHYNRERFFKELDRTEDFTRLVHAMLAPTFCERIQTLPLKMREFAARVYHKIR